MGCAAHPWRTAQARLRGLAIQRREVHGQAMWTAVPGMAHLPAKPRAERRRHGPVRYPNHWLRRALHLHHRPAGAPRPRLDQRHTHPTADWIARQITEAFPWNEAPRYLIRDRDRSTALPSGTDCAP